MGASERALGLTIQASSEAGGRDSDFQVTVYWTTCRK